LHTKQNTISRSVLVVDDEPAMLNYVRHLLEADHYLVQTTTDGQQAVELVRSGLTPDVILLDLNLSGMDGLKTLSELLQLRPGMKVIICSGTPDPRKTISALAMGAHDFLPKPFRHLYLSAALEHCLANQQEDAKVRWSVVQDMWEAAT
jgi:DNA-binding NtrC family response regulator